MLSFNVILALTPSLLFFFYLRGESERGSWSPDYHVRPPVLERKAPTVEVSGWPQKSMEHISKNTYANDSEKCLYASEPGSKVEPTKKNSS